MPESQQPQPQPQQPQQLPGAAPAKSGLEETLAPIAGFGVTFSSLFRPTVTEQYPSERVPTQPRYHGRHQLNRYADGLEKCIGCELCAWACPADAIYVEAGDNTASAQFSPGERYGRVYQINYLRCIFCGLCIEACPTRALTMTNEFELAGPSREGLIYEKADLLAPFEPGMLAAPHPMVEGTDDDDYYRGAVEGPSQGQVEWVRERRPDDPSLAAAETAAEAADTAAEAAGIARADAGSFGMTATTLAPLGLLGGSLAESGVVSAGEATLFWVVAPVMVLGALGLLFARRAVHAAMAIVVVMVGLAILYTALEAPFLGVAQVVVYTGAVMMLFLFVLMLVGVDASDSLVETLRGQRWIAVLAGGGLLVALLGVVLGAELPEPVGLAFANSASNPVGVARLVFGEFVVAFELTGALLITAALGALTLTHRQRLTRRVGQRETTEQKMASLKGGGLLTPLPAPGVYARHNAANIPALDPTGAPIAESVPRVLRIRGLEHPVPGIDVAALLGPGDAESENGETGAQGEVEP